MTHHPESVTYSVRCGGFTVTKSTKTALTWQATQAPSLLVPSSLNLRGTIVVQLSNSWINLLNNFTIA